MCAFHSEANVDRNISHVRKVPSTEIGACYIEVRLTIELGHRAMLSSQYLFGCAK
jgi:hypothetical protein